MMSKLRPMKKLKPKGETVSESSQRPPKCPAHQYTHSKAHLIAVLTQLIGAIGNPACAFGSGW